MWTRLKTLYRCRRRLVVNNLAGMYQRNGNKRIGCTFSGSGKKTRPNAQGRGYARKNHTNAELRREVS
ncbi:hypothetical protein Plhal304r1_c029g0096671 [Plasmopara halstedii]